MIIKFNANNSSNGIAIKRGFFDMENSAAITPFFNSDDQNIDVSVVNEVPDVGFNYEWKNYNEPVKQLLLDIRDSQSAICKFFSEFAGNKVNIFHQAFYAFLENSFFMAQGWGTGYTSYDVFYGDGHLHFKIVLPEERLKHYCGENPWAFDMHELSREDFIKYVLPAYYREIGAWDREKLRKDEGTMAELRKNWITTLDAQLA